MTVNEIQTPEPPTSFTFDSEKDLLGSGTVGEVFRVARVRPADTDDQVQSGPGPATALRS